jgi:hypothetical protein
MKLWTENLAQGRVQFRAVVNTVMNIRLENSGSHGDEYEDAY